MYALMVLGNPLEAAFGKNKLLIIFFVSLLTGSLTSTFLASASSYSVGASGAVTITEQAGGVKASCV